MFKNRGSITGFCRLARLIVGGVNKNGDVIINLLWVTFCSLYGNGLGAEGGTAIAEALKINNSITNIK